MSIYSILGSYGWGYDPNPFEEEKKNLIKYEDSFTKDGQRYCYYCEDIFNPEEMIDFIENDYTYKICKECAL